jgi:hypothetical protein
VAGEAAQESDDGPAWSPPVGTGERIRRRAIWAVALFTASILPAVVGFGIASAGARTANVALLFALAFWVVGVAMALWAAFPTLRHWEGLEPNTRGLGALPMLTISLFLSILLVLSVLL